MSKPIADDTIELMALYALGVPVEALAVEYGLTETVIRKRATYHKVKRPIGSDCDWLNRVARTERIRRHVAEYPSVSLFSDMAEAA